ncbi:MAG: serine/threonine protein kinase [Polyangiaceae bacterium]|nr:serine/threonine protein kinase [Polyangiaceae bacterium]
MKQYTKTTNATRLSAPSLAASRVVSARRSIPDESWAPNRLVPGTPYRVIRPLGEGGMGQVFEVEDEGTGRRFALKAIHRTLCLREDLAQRFRVEARVLGRLHEHPNLVEIVSAGEAADKRVFLVMELLKGCSLEYELAVQRDSPPVPFEELVPWACAVASQMLAALGAAHAEGVFHRDVKPANVFLQAKGGVKLLDFGIAGFLMPRAGSQVKTEPGQVTGTPSYMPPERLAGGKADARTDIFSAGLVLWEMLARQRAMPEGDPVVAATRLVQEGIPSLGSKRGLKGKLPPALIEVVDQATAYDASERFASIAAFAEALRAAMAGLAEPAFVGPLVSGALAPVPFAQAEATEQTGAEGAPTREVSFESSTAPGTQADARAAASSVPSSVDPFGRTPPAGFSSPAPAAGRSPRARSLEHDVAYRDSPTATASVRDAEALAAKVWRARASKAPSESPKASSRPSSSRATMVGVGLVLALGFGLGLASPRWRRHPAEVTQALPAAPREATGGAARADAAAPAEGAPRAEIAKAAEAVANTPTPGEAQRAAAVEAIVVAEGAAEASPSARPEAPATAVAAPEAPATIPPPAAAATAPTTTGAKGASVAAASGRADADASTLMLKAAGVSAAPSGTGKNASTEAATASRGATPPTTPGTTGAARGARKARDEGAKPPAPAGSGWRLKRVIKVEL